MHYSASTGGFYCVEVHGSGIPGDALAIPDADYLRFLGKQIIPGPDGLPVEVVPPVEPPASVTMRQARLALLQTGLLVMVDAAIATLPSPQREAALIEWEFAATVDRKSNTTALLAVALGMTDEELDQLFTLASNL